MQRLINPQRVIIYKFANKIMSKLLNKSRTSIEADFQQSIDVETYLEYIFTVNENMETLTKSLQIAEGLIQQYKLENTQLRNKNQLLNNKISDLNEEIQYLKHMLMKQHNNGVHDKVGDLAKKNELVERKMNELMEELEKSQAKIAKLTKTKQQKTEKSMHNFFEFAKPQPRNAEKQEELNRQIRSLRWKLQQKEQQIMYMIRRNKVLEGSIDRQKPKQKEQKSIHKSFRRVKDEDRFFTCETQNNRSRH